MGAFDVIGEDFQFRLQIGLGALRQAASALAVWRLSEPLAPLAHRDLALIDGARLAARDVLEQLALCV